MQPPPQYSACLYGHDGWPTPARHAQSLHDYVDIDFRFKRASSETGNGYVASRGAQAAAMLDAPQRTCGMAEVLADPYDDVISGAYGDSGAVIARRNERERNRVKTINQTFARLRQHLPVSAAASAVKSSVAPNAGRAKKLSKVQILRAATHYIAQLRQLLMTEDARETSAVSNADYARTLRTQCISISSSSISSLVSVQDQQAHEPTNDSSTAHDTRKTIFTARAMLARSWES